MATYILSTGLSKGKDLSPFQMLPAFRKATRNMMLAWAAIEEALKPFPAIITLAPSSSLGIILGSGFGELDTTRNFLQSLVESGTPRPLLFQNSLHNATLGFLTLQLKLTGCGISVSNRCFTGENCLEIALTLLEQRQCRFCLVIGVDSEVPPFSEALSRIHETPIKQGEGAAALLLTHDEELNLLSQSPLARLDDILVKTGNDSAPSFQFEGYYEADAIEKLANSLNAASSSKSCSLVLEKPDGTQSRITYTRGPF